jgi:hypothetical protein
MKILSQQQLAEMMGLGLGIQQQQPSQTLCIMSRAADAVPMVQLLPSSTTHNNAREVRGQGGGNTAHVSADQARLDPVVGGDRGHQQYTRYS